MIKKNNLLYDTKKEFLKNIYQSQLFKIAKYGSVVIISIYGLGYFFKILAFTSDNFKILKESVKPQ